MNQSLSGFKSLLIFLLIAAFIGIFVTHGCQGLGSNTNQANRTISGVRTQSNQTVITVNSQTITPAFIPLGTVNEGSQWQLIDWWDNHETSNGQGIDWGFFSEYGAQVPRIIVARCENPTWKNPRIGDLFSYSNGQLTSESDPIKTQHFAVFSEVTNPNYVPSTPTFSVPTQSVQAVSTPDTIVRTHTSIGDFFKRSLQFLFLWVLFVFLVFAGIFAYYRMRSNR